MNHFFVNNFISYRHRYEDIHKCKDNIRKIRENKFLNKKEAPPPPPAQAIALKPTQNFQNTNNNQIINAHSESLEVNLKFLAFLIVLISFVLCVDNRSTILQN